MRPWLFTAFLVLPLVTACGGDDEGTGEAPVDPTYTEDVARILDSNCAGCHTDPPTGGAPATVRLDTFDDAVSHIDRVIARGVDGDPGPMPPGGLALSDADAATLVRWQETGTPE